MVEILQKLLQNELLSEETKAEISEQWETAVDSFKMQIREEVSGEVRAELAEQWITERDELITKVDDFVAEALTKEIDELKGDIERFRDLEADYAEKLVEEKHQLANEVAEELDELVDKIDAFFEMRLTAELDEFKEDLEVVKQNEFGSKIFEAFASEYGKHYVDENSIQSKLIVTEDKLADAEAQLAALEDEHNKLIREAKLDQVLSNLTGKKREQMAMVLKNVDTSRLDESYKFFIGRILKEEVPETKPLTEETTTKSTVVTGDPAPSAPKGISQETATMRRIAGFQ